MEHAEFIIKEESMARNRRCLKSVMVEKENFVRITSQQQRQQQQQQQHFL
jgi:hypothetical protein